MKYIYIYTYFLVSFIYLGVLLALLSLVVLLCLEVLEAQVVLWILSLPEDQVVQEVLRIVPKEIAWFFTFKNNKKMDSWCIMCPIAFKFVTQIIKFVFVLTYVTYQWSPLQGSSWTPWEHAVWKSWGCSFCHEFSLSEHSECCWWPHRER